MTSMVTSMVTSIVTNASVSDNIRLVVMCGDRTTGVTSCLTLVEVLLSNVVISPVIFVIRMNEIVSRNCAHLIANVEDVFNNDALLVGGNVVEGTKMFAM